MRLSNQQSFARGFIHTALAGVILSGCSFFDQPDGEREPIEGNAFMIDDVRVFDGATVIDSTDVLVVDGRIKMVGTVEPDDGVPVINGAGKTLIPGLIDAHVHTFGEDGLRDALRFGVTAQLDMFTRLDLVTQQQARRDGFAKTDMADLFAAGTLVTAAGGHGTQFGVPIPTIESPEEAPAFVAARLAEGSEWIKIVYEPDHSRFNSISKGTLAALVDAAHANDVIAVVHISTLAAARDAVAAGADGLVHIFADAPIDDALVNAMRAADMFVIPTLSVIASANGKGLGPILAADPAIVPYLNAGQIETIVADFGAPPQVQALFDLTTAGDTVLRLSNAGIPILAGVDAPNPGTTYGASMHGELLLLVQAGLTPTEALRAATSTVADAFSLEGRGGVAPGMRADLILINGDPTTDISASKNIARIFKNGYEVERNEAAKSGPPVRPTLDDGLVSNFDEDLKSGFGVTWAPTTDQLAGGASVATVTQKDGVLHVEGEVSTKFFFPWSGAGIFFSADFTKRYDLSDYETLRFKARGSARDLSVTFFTRTSRQRPATFNFKATDAWQEIEIALDDVRSLAKDDIYGFSINAGRPKGPFMFEIDDVRFE